MIQSFETIDKEKERLERLRQKKIAERNKLTKEKEEYLTSQGKLNTLIQNISECENYLVRTYEKINEGISCGEKTFTQGIASIQSYKVTLESCRNTLNNINDKITNKINDLIVRINKLNSEI